ncbi:MAG: hypothetical protein IJO18_00095 [Alphaproteobacteria bacterium]|nr:hypothetical protein [Alphaproteobacteria bacterium]
MADVVNNRVNQAMAELKKRAERLSKLKERAKDKRVPMSFAEGMRLVSQMIEGHAELIDKVVFEAPKTSLEQMRNLALTTGNADQTVSEGISATTGAIDAMLESLEQMLMGQKTK